jgi:23S rRNA G2445 N2-methylase RlmL
MTAAKPEIKLSFVTGLKEIVLSELSKYKGLQIIKEDEDSLYLDNVQNWEVIKNLRSVSRAYLVIQNENYNPLYLSKHKSILDDLIKIVLKENGQSFKTFKINCAGSDSIEVRKIVEYIREKYLLVEKDETDLKIHIIKLPEIWEIGIQLTARPLSFREYKVNNMSGAMDPTIAYAVNSLAGLENATSYLNAFSGSATLLIEAGQCFPNLEKLIGFDNNKKHLSLAMQNIKKAGLIRKIELKEADIFEKPNFGKFDVITTDLPFGMAISKNTDLEKLYETFIEFAEETLVNGKLVVYTSEYEILEKIIKKSKFKIIKTLELKFITSVDAYLRPKIFVCEFLH